MIIILFIDEPVMIKTNIITSVVGVEPFPGVCSRILAARSWLEAVGKFLAWVDFVPVSTLAVEEQAETAFGRTGEQDTLQCCDIVTEVAAVAE